MVHEICLFTLVPLSFNREVLTLLTVTKELIECSLLSVELFELFFSIKNWRLYIWEMDIQFI